MMQAQYDQGRKTTTLLTTDGPAQEVVVRGGICWPMLVTNQVTQIVGHAVLGLQDVETGVLRVVEELEFSTIHNLLTARGDQVEWYGLADWINRQRIKYYAHLYYWHQPDHVAQPYILDVHRSHIIVPKPNLIKSPVVLDDAAVMLWRRVQERSIKLPSDSKCVAQLRQYKSGEDAQPGVHALLCLVAGLDSFPWRPPRED